MCLLQAECPQIQCCADNVALSYALNQYLASSSNHLVNFSLLLQANWFPNQDHGSNETLVNKKKRGERKKEKNRTEEQEEQEEQEQEVEYKKGRRRRRNNTKRSTNLCII